MLPRCGGDQPLRHLYLFVASEGFLEGSEIYNGVLIDSRKHKIWFSHLRYAISLFPINGILILLRTNN